MNRKWGWKRDKQDKRDWIYKAPLKYTLPPKVDLRPACTPVEDQGSLGSCVAFACIGAMEYLDARDQEWNDFSQLFEYYNARSLAGNEAEDTGSYLRDGIKALNNWGACHARTWPYVTAQFAVKPPEHAYSEAVNYKAVQYYRITDAPVDLGAVKSALAEGFPVVYGFWVFDHIYRIGDDGILPELLDSDDFLGGHAVMLVGYDEATQLFTVRNSWGTTWPTQELGGYFYMPYDFLSRFGSDFWVLQKVSNVDTTPEPPPEPIPTPPVPPDPAPVPPEPTPPDPAPEPRRCACSGLWRKLGLMK